MPGLSAPQGCVRHELRTNYLRVPPGDFAALAKGRKTEFRMPYMGAVIERLQVPTPVVIYAISRAKSSPPTKLMVLVEVRSEHISDIAEQPESLMDEGFESYDHFRTYWRRRTRRPYRALDRVHVFRLAPWVPVSANWLGRELLDRLYGEFM